MWVLEVDWSSYVISSTLKTSSYCDEVGQCVLKCFLTAVYSVLNYLDLRGRSMIKSNAILVSAFY